MPAIPPPYNNSDVDSYAYYSVKKRMPGIIAAAIADVQLTLSELAGDNSGDQNQAKIKEGETIVAQMEQLKREMDSDGVIAPFEKELVQAQPDLAEYNAYLDNYGKAMHWHTAPWMFSECLMYRRMHTFVTATREWREYDIFHRQKTDAFRASRAGVVELADRYRALSAQLAKASGKVELDVLEELFREFVDVSLWGNATDLCHLKSLAELEAVQGAEKRKASSGNVLVNELDQAWNVIASELASKEEEEGRRIEVVLDNAGFELFADMVFVLFLLDSGIASTVVVHPKDLPWYVSDVLPVDINDLFAQLQDPSFFVAKTEQERADLDFLADKLKSFYSSGKLQVHTNAFWTTHHNYDQITATGAGKDVWQDMQSASLVVVKGDLNHRRLLSDLVWPRTTPFRTGIQALATSSGLRILTLRTCKADAVVGLPAGREEELERQWVKEHGEGVNRHAWAHSGRWAVVQFSDGKK